jgi:superoxide dismutase
MGGARAAAPAGCCCPGRRATASWSTSGPRTIATLAGGTPILALDMYEHSYHMDFGAKAASYVDTFMDAVRWNNAEQLFVRMTGD